MQANWKTFLVIIILGVVVGFFLRPVFFPEVEVERTVKATEVDSVDIIQKARIGWIAQDQMDIKLQNVFALLEKEKGYRQSKVKWETKYNYVDSLRIKDSVAVRYMSYFYADTTFSFKKQTDKWRMKSDIGFNTKFYPGINMIQSKAVMNSFEIVITYKEPWRFDLMSAGVGLGIGAAFTAGMVYLVK